MLLVFLCVRGAFLWIIFPAGLVLWFAARLLGPRRSRGLRPGMTIGWLDHNVSEILTRLLPTMSSEKFLGWSQVRDHRRPALIDPLGELL